ncbi:hypothetical protein [Bacteroides xylanisolvens]|uniref:hypothetical protein n=1 Tax=Bacteroides xylanisolvens TaxID=371601 RepID=UPI0003163346|nr:hypothetical protein [Bacteroides xylanisolvens]
MLCSGRRKFIDLIQIPIVSSNIAALKTSIDGSIFFTCTTCIVYQYFKELAAFVSKAGAKVKALFLTTKLFRIFFIFFFLLISQALYAKGKECIKEKTKAVFFANRTAKIRTLFIIIQNFSEVFLFFSLSAISLFHYVNSARLSSLGKRVQKYTLLVYNPNILNYFFEVFLKESAKTLKDNDVVEHIFLS